MVQIEGIIEATLPGMLQNPLTMLFKACLFLPLLVCTMSFKLCKIFNMVTLTQLSFDLLQIYLRTVYHFDKTKKNIGSFNFYHHLLLIILITSLLSLFFTVAISSLLLKKNYTTTIENLSFTYFCNLSKRLITILFDICLTFNLLIFFSFVWRYIFTNTKIASA